MWPSLHKINVSLFQMAQQLQLYVRRTRLFWWLADLTGIDEWETEKKKIFFMLQCLLCCLEWRTPPNLTATDCKAWILLSAPAFASNPQAAMFIQHIHTSILPDARLLRIKNLLFIQTNLRQAIEWNEYRSTLHYSGHVYIFQMQSVFRFIAYHLFIVVSIIIIDCHFHRQRAITNSYTRSGSAFYVNGCVGCSVFLAKPQS